MGGVIRYRFATPAVVGEWQDSYALALCEAFELGQALLDSKDPGRIILHEWAIIEEIDEA